MIRSRPLGTTQWPETSSQRNSGLLYRQIQPEKLKVVSLAAILKWHLGTFAQATTVQAITVQATIAQAITAQEMLVLATTVLAIIVLGITALVIIAQATIAQRATTANFCPQPWKL